MSVTSGAKRKEGGIGEFLSHLGTVPDAVTRFDTSSRAGISISCKR
jgi:hypothetical protein